MGDVELYPVMVSDAERERVKVALQEHRESLEKERKKLTRLSVGTGDVDAALATIKGDGVGPGLLGRFKPRGTRDMFDRDPTGELRFLHDPEEAPDRDAYDDDAAYLAAMDAWDGPEEQDPIDPDDWRSKEDLVAYVAEAAEASVKDLRAYAEDADGDVWRVAIDVDVGLEHVGRRPEHEVEAAVDAAEDADDGHASDSDATRLDQLRRLAVRIIEDDATDLPVGVRKRAVAYAGATDDRVWLKAWADDDAEWPEVPEGWEPDVDLPLGEPGGLDEIKITEAARSKADHVGLGAADLEGLGTGQGGRVLLADVEDEINRRISEGSS